MKVLHVYKAYLPDDFTGIPRVIHTIAEELVDDGVESHVLTVGDRLADEASVRIGRHWVHRAPRDLNLASTDISLAIFRIFSILIKDIDIIHYHFPWPVCDLLHLLFGGLTKPNLVTYHSDIVKQRFLLPFYYPLMHRFLFAVDAIVATSPNYSASSPVLARHSSKVEVISIGVGPRIPPDPVLIEKWRTRLPENFFFFLGVTRYYKGLDFLIAAAAATGLPVVIAGATKGDFNLPVDLPNLFSVGEVSEEDKEALFELAAAFVFPSHLRSEAFGIALAEAGRAGKPMISCEIGTGTSYINLDRITGIVVPPADPEALAAAMCELAGNPARAAEMGWKAQRRVAEQFSAAEMAESYHRLYRRLLGMP